MHELIDVLVSDLVRADAPSDWAAAKPASAAEVVELGSPLIALSDDVAAQQAELERLLFERVYRHPTLLDKRAYAAHALEAMFDVLIDGRRAAAGQVCGDCGQRGAAAGSGGLSGRHDRPFRPRRIRRAASAQPG